SCVVSKSTLAHAADDLCSLRHGGGSSRTMVHANLHLKMGANRVSPSTCNRCCWRATIAKCPSAKKSVHKRTEEKRQRLQQRSLCSLKSGWLRNGRKRAVAQLIISPKVVSVTVREVPWIL